LGNCGTAGATVQAGTEVMIANRTAMARCKPGVFVIRALMEHE
jgi:hypothetical protein